MPLALPCIQDRWERQLIARGGYQKKRSGRFTKPGLRLRSVEIDEVEPVDVLDNLNVKDFVPGRRTARVTYDVETSPLYYGHTRTIADSTTTTGTGAIYTGTGTADYTWSTTGASSTTDTWVVNGNIYPDSNGWITINAPYEPLSPDQKAEIARIKNRDRFRARIRAQVVDRQPYSKRGQADFTNVSQPEIVALQLMRKMLSPDEWKRYLRYGFVMVHSEVTGLDYQVYRGGGNIQVFCCGEKMASLCIHISDRKCPPTDRVIAKKIMLEANELDVWMKSNISECRQLCSRKPKLEDLIALGATQVRVPNVAVGAENEAPRIFTAEAVRRSQEPIHTIQFA